MPGKPNTTQSGRGWEWQLLCKEAKRTYPWICHLCGGHIEQHPTDPGGDWTLDHLVPIAIAGTRVPRLEDTRPAHRRCNASRGTKPIVTSRRSTNW